MKRSFNYTGRKAIPRGSVTFHLQQATDKKDAPSFSANLSGLSSLGLPTDAAVYVEPYVGGSSAMRFSFGTIGEMRAPVTTRLDELDAGGRILFRVKVVDERAAVGRLLAEVSAIAPRDEDDEAGRKPLLPLRHEDLEQELWKLVVTDAGGPELLVNNRIPGLADQLKSSALLQGLVIPAALRIVASFLFSSEEQEWAGEWRAFMEDLHGEAIEWDSLEASGEEDRNPFIENMIRKFATKHAFADRVRLPEQSTDA